jgi:hypothetical protein
MRTSSFGYGRTRKDVVWTFVIVMIMRLWPILRKYVMDANPRTAIALCCASATIDRPIPLGPQLSCQPSSKTEFVTKMPELDSNAKTTITDFVCDQFRTCHVLVT